MEYRNGVEVEDLGLTYYQALHGVQSAIAFDMTRGEKASSPKHLRVGIDSLFVNDAAIAQLLIAKGVFTFEEYAESVRLEANYELSAREKEAGVKFR